MSQSSSSARVVKRSLTIAGHRTSISLEDAFWQELKSLATARGVSIATLVSTLDADRSDANLSSAIRVYLFQNLKTLSAPAA